MSRTRARLGHLLGLEVSIASARLGHFSMPLGVQSASSPWTPLRPRGVHSERSHWTLRGQEVSRARARLVHFSGLEMSIASTRPVHFSRPRGVQSESSPWTPLRPQGVHSERSPWTLFEATRCPERGLAVDISSGFEASIAITRPEHFSTPRGVHSEGSP